MQLGAVTEADRTQHQRWFAAILAVAKGEEVRADDVPLEVPDLEERLEGAGMSPTAAQTVARAGAWPEVRSPAGQETALPALVAAGIGLRELSDTLERLGEPRLRIGVAQHRFRAWRVAHLPWIVATLVESGIEATQAKDQAAQVPVPADCEFDLDPPLDRLLAPFALLLESSGVTVSPEALADDPPGALAKSVGLSVADLGDRARLLYDEQARSERLRMLAERWRAELIHIVLLATAAGQTRSTTRSQAEALEKRIPRVAKPSELTSSLTILPGTYEALMRALRDRLRDDLPGVPPTRTEVLALAEQYGLHTSESATITAALEAPRRQRVETLTRKASQLKEAHVKPTVPSGLAPEYHLPDHSPQQQRPKGCRRQGRPRKRPTEKGTRR